jgi:hypothetical protein
MINGPGCIFEGEVDVFQMNGKNSINYPGFTFFKTFLINPEFHTPHRETLLRYISFW